MLRLALFTAAILTGSAAQAQWSAGSLSQARGRPAAVTVGDLVLVAGGEDPSLAINSDVVDVYDAIADTWSTAYPLSVARSRLAGTAVGHYALLAGGGIDSQTPLDVVDIYDASVGAPSNSAAWSTTTLSQPRSSLVATTVGNKAIFAGGATATGASDVVDIYDASLGAPSNSAAWSTTTLSQPRFGLTAITAGSQAIFAGGANPVPPPGIVLDTVDIYDDSTGLWTTAVLSQARILPAAASIGRRAYFGGGAAGAGNIPSDVLDVYDARTGLWEDSTLPEVRFNLQAAALGNTLIFACGGDGFGALTTVVHRFNVGTGQWDSSAQLSQGRYFVGVATVAGKALFAGGLVEPLPNSQATTSVEVYEPVGLNYCVATTNSTGCAASIGATGSASLAVNDLALNSTCVPNGVFLFFHGGAGQQTPFGNGLLCAGGTVIRITPAGTASGGLAQVTVDLPSAGITSPGLRNFQCWFRDPSAGGAGFDTSDALAITFVP